MKKIVKQVGGIDVAQKEPVVYPGRMYDDWSPELYAHKTFANTVKDFVALLLWLIMNLVFFKPGSLYETKLVIVNNSYNKRAVIIPWVKI